MSEIERIQHLEGIRIHFTDINHDSRMNCDGPCACNCNQCTSKCNQCTISGVGAINFVIGGYNTDWWSLWRMAQILLAIIPLPLIFTKPDQALFTTPETVRLSWSPIRKSDRVRIIVLLMECGMSNSKDQHQSGSRNRQCPPVKNI